LFCVARNILGRSILPNSLGDLSAISFRTISSILNRKAACFHFSAGLLDPKDLTLDLNREGSDLFWDSFKINA
jgi:hypothetical protein